MNFLRALFLLLSLTGVSLRAASFDEAAAALSSPDYPKAAAALEKIIKVSGPSAARLYNLGNARFRMGEIGPAILAYEKAALISPRDAGIVANLKLARDAAKSPASQPDRRWWEQPLHFLSLHEWSWLAAAGAVFVAVMICLAAFSKKYRAKSLGVMAAAVCLTVFSAAALVHRAGERSHAVITTADPNLRLSPFEAADSTGSLSSGTMVQVEKTENGWRYVSSLSGGIKGWLREKDAGMVMAP